MSPIRTPRTARALATLPLAAGLILGSTALSGAAFAAVTPVHASAAHVVVHKSHRVVSHRKAKAHSKNHHVRRNGTRIGGTESGPAKDGAAATSTGGTGSTGQTVTVKAASTTKSPSGTKSASKSTAKNATKPVVQVVSSTVTKPAAVTPASPVALTPFEARLVVLINQARAAAGLNPLTVVAGATDVARRWSVQLAVADALSHNGDLVNDLQSAGSADWTFAAENVGEGCPTDPDGLFAAYMASEHHRDNILDPRATDLGIGAVAVSEPEGDVEFNTMDFTNAYDNSYGANQTSAVATELTPATIGSAVG